MADLGELEMFKLAIYFASYLYFLAAPALLWLVVKRNGAARWAALGLFAVVSLFAYGRFIEPRMLFAPEHNVRLDRCFAEEGSLRIAVAADFHIGLFGNAMPVSRIVERINGAAPEVVLLPGDFSYFLDPKENGAVFAAFDTIDAPVYGVLGNHDHGLPGPDVSTPLRKTLLKFDVKMIDDSALSVAVENGDIELVALSDDWAGHQNLALLNNAVAEPRIVLTHNAASVRKFSHEATVDLLIAGHTHGGQILLPVLTCALTSMCEKRRYGLSRAEESYPLPRTRALQQASGPDARKDTLIFTTSGTGMVGLPMRFLVPPRVDVLNVSWGKCRGV